VSAAKFGPGHITGELLFLIEGTVRVSHMSEGGREIVLYRIEAGQSCVLTTACVLADEAQSAEGTAETAVRAVSLPRAAFEALASEFPEFRDFVFAAYAKRLSDLFRVIDEVAFGRIDIRLAGRLVELVDDEGTVRRTHQDLAVELGTAREVISRQLHEFHRRGWIEQARGVVTIADTAALEHLAEKAA
jgi:CRP/FNR family transcriptional regulator